MAQVEWENNAELTNPPNETILDEFASAMSSLGVAGEEDEEESYYLPLAENGQDVYYEEIEEARMGVYGNEIGAVPVTSSPNNSQHLPPSAGLSPIQNPGGYGEDTTTEEEDEDQTNAQWLAEKESTECSTRTVRKRLTWTRVSLMKSLAYLCDGAHKRRGNIHT